MLVQNGKLLPWNRYVQIIPSRGEDDDSVTYKGEAVNCIFWFKSDAYLKLCLAPNQFCHSYLNAYL